MITEKHITATAKLYEYRNTLRSFWGHEYHSKLERYMIHVNNYANNQNKEIIIATMELVKKTTDGMLQLILWAAAVELMEPSEPVKTKSLNERLNGSPS